MILNPLKRIFNSQEKRVAAVIILIICLIILTPLCGILFQCGCDWPWQGLDEKCNFHNPHAVEQCPWCVSMITGVLSNGIAIVIGIGVSSISIEVIKNQHPVKEILIRLVIGVVVFILIAILTTALLVLHQLWFDGYCRADFSPLFTHVLICSGLKSALHQSQPIKPKLSEY